MKYKFDKKEHLHTLDGIALTGTSSIGNVLAKPLTWWASGKAVEVLGWLNPKKFSNGNREIQARTKLEEISEMGVGEYIALLDEAYKAHSVSLKDSADKGTDLHVELEHWVKAQMGKVPERADYDSKIKPFIDWAKENVKKFLWSEANCFDEELFVGGISDAGCEMKGGKLAVIDFKSSKAAYPTSFLQVAGYAIQIEKNGLFDEGGKVNKKIDGKIGALIVVPFGAEVVIPEIRYEVEAYKTGFRQAVGLYRLLGLDERIKVAKETN